MTDLKIGNLYFDDNTKLTPDYKILNFSREYCRKFGRSPQVCFTNPKTYAETIGDAGFTPTSDYKLVHGIRVVPDGMISINHFYLGEME